jgi:hypothetical protein
VIAVEPHLINNPFLVCFSCVSQDGFVTIQKVLRLKRQGQKGRKDGKGRQVANVKSKAAPK